MENNIQRPLSDMEKTVLLKLLTVNFRGRDELLDQSKSCLAVPTGDPDNYGSIYLTTTSPVRAFVSSRVPVEGLAKDKDGAEVVILLHTADGFLRELEFVRSDGEPMIAPVDPSNMKVKIS